MQTISNSKTNMIRTTSNNRRISLEATPNQPVISVITIPNQMITNNDAATPCDNRVIEKSVIILHPGGANWVSSPR